jgi:hypothetical protein
MSKLKNIILDFDGVLADTLEATIQSLIKMGDSNSREEAKQQIYKHANNPPVVDKSIIMTSELALRRQNWTTAFSHGINHFGFDIFGEFVSQLKKLENTRFALVSRGSITYMQSKFDKIGLDFTHILTFEDHHSKEIQIDSIAKDWKIEVTDIYYFTDTKSDVFELEKFLDSKKIIGCGWGFSGYEKLLEILPDEQILKKHLDLEKISFE